MKNQCSPMLWSVFAIALLGCGGSGSDGGSGTEAEQTAAGGAGAESTTPTGGTAATAETARGDAGGGSAGALAEPEPSAPPEPFVLESDGCRPQVIDTPDPVYAGDSVFARIGSVSGHGNDVYFAESADFNDIPPRIGILHSDGTVDTLFDGDAGLLEVFGDTLYFLGDSGLMSLDLTDPSAAPAAVMEVSGILAYDDKTVIYSDDNDVVWSVKLGAADLSGAVQLSEERPWSVSLFEDALYLSDGETVTRQNIDGSGESPLFPPDSFNYISLVGADATTVFFDNDMVLSSVPAAGGEPVELGTGGGDSLFSGTSRFAQFLPGRSVVYWVDDSSSYGWTALDGMSCGILGEYDSFFAAEGHLTDDSFVVGGDSGLYRVPRVD